MSGHHGTLVDLSSGVVARPLPVDNLSPFDAQEAGAVFLFPWSVVCVRAVAIGVRNR